MSSHKSDIDETYCKLYYGNYAVTISFNVKDISLITYSIHTVKGLLHISITRPMAVFHNICPYLERKKRVRMCLSEFF